MGAWGPGIFSDDLAADVRGDWRDAVLAGEDAEAVTDRILRPYRQASPGPGQDPQAAIAWMALAAAQFETGRLLDRVRDRALAFIEAGGDLELWEDGAAARRRVLERLAATLRGPQPAPKRLRGSRSHAVEFALGDVVRLQAREAEALCVVIGFGDDGSRDPRVELLAWRGGEVPDADTLASLPVVPDSPQRPLDLHAYEVTTPRRRDAFGPHLGAVVARGVIRPKARPRTHHGFTTWPGLAELIAGPWYRGALDLAFDPERLGRLRRELAAEIAPNMLESLRESLARRWRRKPVDPANVVTFVERLRDMRDCLTPEQAAAFERLVARAEALGVDLEGH